MKRVRVEFTANAFGNSGLFIREITMTDALADAVTSTGAEFFGDPDARVMAAVGGKGLVKLCGQMAELMGFEAKSVKIENAAIVAEDVEE